MRNYNRPSRGKAPAAPIDYPEPFAHGTHCLDYYRALHPSLGTVPVYDWDDAPRWDGWSIRHGREPGHPCDLRAPDLCDPWGVTRHANLCAVWRVNVTLSFARAHGMTVYGFLDALGIREKWESLLRYCGPNAAPPSPAPLPITDPTDVLRHVPATGPGLHCKGIARRYWGREAVTDEERNIVYRMLESLLSTGHVLKTLNDRNAWAYRLPHAI